MAAASEVQGGGASPPLLSRNRPLLGHLLELRRDPLALMGRLRQECGEIGEFNLAGNRIVLFTGAEAQEAFFRAPDEQLDQAAAYPFMKPIFGEGVVFDATPEQRKQAMRNQSLRDKFMRGSRRGDRGRGRAHDRGLGRPWRAGRPRLLLRADALHVQRVPDRSPVSRRAGTGVRRRSSRNSSAAPTPSRT